MGAWHEIRRRDTITRAPAVVLAAVAAALVHIVVPPAALAAGPSTRGYAVDELATTVVAFDPATDTVTARIPVPAADIHNLAIRPDGAEVYVPLRFDAAVAVISTATDTLVGMIPVGSFPAGVAFSSDSRRAYVANQFSQSISVIDTQTRSTVGTIQLADQPHEPAMSPDGSRIYVGTSAPVVVSRKVAVISTATNTVTGTIPLTAGGSTTPSRVVFSPDGGKAFVNTGDLIDTSTEKVTKFIPFGTSVEDAEFSADGSHVYVAEFCAGPDLSGVLSVVDVGTGQTTAALLAGQNPISVRLAPDGSRLYVALQRGGGIAVVDPATNQVVDTFGVAGPAGPRPLLTYVAVSDTPPVVAPGERFAPRPSSSPSCEI